MPRVRFPSRLALALAALIGCSCARTTKPDAGTSSSETKDGSPSSSGTASCSKAQITAAAKSSPCMVSESVATVSFTAIDKVDLLFVIDNSSSMARPQAKLRAQFPHLLTVLATGDKDGDGAVDFPPVKSLHLGVVTTDMGTPGVPDISGCSGLGQDGILRHDSDLSNADCQNAYPPFLEYVANASAPARVATDLACIASVGTRGCAFPSALEAPLKALWPSVDPGSKGGQNRILFHSDPSTNAGMLGHGDVENAGFLRNDPTKGVSLIAVVVITDRDDCSVSDTRVLTPPLYLPQNDPLVMQSLSLRCHFNQNSLYPLDRYALGLKALRPGNENLVVFGAIAGVPGDLVNLAKMPVDFHDRNARDQFYNRVLSDARMQEVINNQGTPDPGDDTLQFACNDVAGAAATPPIRLAKVAQQFGENGIVQSICADDYGPAIDAIVDRIAPQLGAVCLPRPIERASSGMIGCKLVWELPAVGTAPAGAPVNCGRDRPWLLAPEKGEPQTTDSGGKICKVAQLAVKADAQGALAAMPTETDGQRFSDGWYYDDFSDETRRNCTGPNKQRIAFTPAANPPFGVAVKLKCVVGEGSEPMCEQNAVASCSDAHVGSACLPENIPEGGFSDLESYVQTGSPDCKGGVCLVYKLRGDPLRGCAPSASNVCASASDVMQRVYCSCRCNSHGEKQGDCACPDGFSCVDILEQGGPGVQGGYCVRNGTFTSSR